MTLSDLEEGERYCFRVSAKTTAVTSLPSEETDTVLVRQAIGKFKELTCVKDDTGECYSSLMFFSAVWFNLYELLNLLYIDILYLASPRIELGAKCKNGIEVRAGQDILIDATIFGKPKPSVQWTKDGVNFESSTDGLAKVETSLNSTKIMIKYDQIFAVKCSEL